MGLIEEITKLFTRNRGQKTTADLPPERPSAGANDVYSRFKVEGDRVSRTADSRQIYADDPRAKGIMATLARDVTKGIFQIECDDKKAVQIAEALRDRLGLNKRLDDWVRLTLRDGDSFIEVGITEDRQIALVTRKPTLNMDRNCNETDRFSDPSRAFWYDKRKFVNNPMNDALWFAEWQIIHARWDHDEGEKYGCPLMSSGRKSWKRFDEGELDVAVRRKTRAGMRYEHTVKGDAAAIAAYKKANKPALDNPFAANLDFFVNENGGIKSISGDQQLGNIADIIHHIETWWTGSPVPRVLVGYSPDSSHYNMSEQQKEQYEEELESVWDWVVDQLIRPLLELQWLLAGILPETIEYKITRPSKKIVTPDDILKIVQAAQQMRALGFPPNVIAAVVTRFLPGIDPDMLLEDGEWPGAGNDSGKLATIENHLAGLMGQ